MYVHCIIYMGHVISCGRTNFIHHPQNRIFLMGGVQTIPKWWVYGIVFPALSQLSILHSLLLVIPQLLTIINHHFFVYGIGFLPHFTSQSQ